MKTFSSNQPYDFDHAVIFNSMAEGIYVHDQEMTITYLNPAAADISGWKIEEALGRKCYQVFGDKDNVCQALCPFQRALATGQSVVSVMRRIQCLNGGFKDVQVMISPYLKNNIPVGAIVLIRDVSENAKTLAAYQQEIAERKQIENALSRRNDILSAISALQNEFLLEEDSSAFFGKLINFFLDLTASRYGFIAEIGYSPEEDLFLECLAFTGLPSETHIGDSPHRRGGSGLRLTSLDNVLGDVVRSGKIVIANDPQRDLRGGKLPPGHPALASFLGLPLYAGKDLVGMIGLANRPQGYDQTLVDEIKPVVGAAANLAKAYCAERDRRERNQLISVMADTIDDVFWVIDWQTKQTRFASKSFETIWGQPRALLYQQPNTWASAIHPDDRLRVVAAMARMEDGFIFDEQYRILRPDGDTRWIREHAVLIRTDMEPVQAAGVAQDITKWRLMELDNAKLRQRLEFILGITNTRLTIIDENFVLRYVDPASVQKHGPYEERPCFDYVKCQDFPCDDGGVTCCLKTKIPMVRESVIPQENYRPVQISTIPFIDEAGEQLFAQVTVDISQLKRAEQALRDSERLYRELVETTSAIPWELDIETRRFTYVGPQATDILGYPPEEWTDFTFCSSLVVPEDREVAVALCLEATTRGEDHRLDYRMQTREGRVVWIHNMVSVIKEDGRPRWLRGFFFDITPLKEAELALGRHANTQELHNRLLELSFSTLTLTETLSQCLALITTIPWLHVQPKGVIFLKDPKQDVLVLKAQVGLPDDVISACGRVEFAACLCGQAAQTETVIWVNEIDGRHTIRYAGMKPHGHFCVPFFSSQHKLLGVFTLYIEPQADRDKSLEDTLIMLAKVLALIIERKLIEEEIVKARDEWASTFDAVSDMIMIIDSDYRVIKVNRAMADRLGGAPDTFQGEFCYRLLHNTESELASCPHAQTLNDGQSHTCEIREEWLDCDFSCSVAPIEISDGRVTRTVHVLNDISERIAHERQLRQHADTQAELLREVNHRVKNNLTAILSIIHKEEDRATSENRDYDTSRLSEIESRIEGLLIVHSMLSASMWQPLFLNALCREVAQRTIQVVSGNAEQITLLISPSIVRVTSDQAHYLALVINELTTNTIKYAIQGQSCCQIGITITQDGDRIGLTYQDDGPGFPEVVLSGNLHAIGIGLDLVTGIVNKSLRGELTFSNESGGVVRITFGEKTESSIQSGGE